MKQTSIFILFSLFSLSILAQENTDSNADSLDLTSSEMPEIKLNTDNRLFRFLNVDTKQLDKYKDMAKNVSNAFDDLSDLAGKVKLKKNEFLGIKTKKGVIRGRKGNKTSVEKFHYLNEYKSPPKYIEDKYFFVNEKKKRQVIVSDKDAVSNGKLLHGAYLKIINGNIREQGFYYLGVKHGRWETYDENFNLISKRHYVKGFPKDSKFEYYDEKKGKLKEIIPIYNDFKDGMYLSFYPSGRISEQGEYQDGEKIGKWREFYDNDNIRRKKEIMYPKKAFDPKAKPPTVIREWDTKGKLLIDKREN